MEIGPDIEHHIGDGGPMKGRAFHEPGASKPEEGILIRDDLGATGVYVLFVQANRRGRLLGEIVRAARR